MFDQQTPKMKRYTIKDFDRDFPNDAACLDWLKNYLYPDGITCENDRCKRYGKVTKHYRDLRRRSYSCAYCGYHVHPAVGTIFHKSPTSLKSWFYAIFLMAQTRCGISAKQLERELGVTYKTAWRMFRQIRSMLADPRPAPPLGGAKPVEADEAYIGGVQPRKRGKPNPDDTNKVSVLGIAERNGRIRAFVTPVTADALLTHIARNVNRKSTIYTDDSNYYDWLKHLGFDHHSIAHYKKVYVDGDIHTNTIEGFWSLVKRGTSGVYHRVGRDYLQDYLNEFAFRYSHRFDYQPMFRTFLGQIAVHRGDGVRPF
jgi:transposase-like protein